MSKFFKILISISIFYFLFHINLSFANNTKTFLVSAYCSPAPHHSQAYKKLNWWWIYTASWKKVFVWVAAWPKNYPFWTKIYLEGYWIIDIEDRWCAIVAKWEDHYCKVFKNFVKPKYDRIDIWMWYWDECQKRAKIWWKKLVKWKIILSSYKANIKFSNTWLQKINWNQNYKDTTKEIQIILNAPVIKLNWDNPQIQEVKKVQTLFKKLWLYKWEINWNYNSIKEQILKIQKQAWIIKNENSWWAWYFWEKTRKALLKYFEKQAIRRKKLTIDDLTYSMLKQTWEFIKKSKKKNIYLKKLKSSLKKIKNKEHKQKIEYIISIIER